MTCTHVLGVIDAGPFVDVPRAQREAALAHARQCQACRVALEASVLLSVDLAALPEPAAPPELAASILRRIEGVSRARAVAEAERTAERPRSLSGLRDWPAWSTAFGGSVAGLSVVLSMPRVHDALAEWPQTADSRVVANLLEQGPGIVGGVVLVAGLLLFAVGLLAPLGDRNRRDAS
jgi:hypothetical protein